MNIEYSIKTLKEFNKIKINSYAMQFVNISYPDLQEAIETILTAYEKEKRLAEANLKDSEEFQDNMCNHRCILNSKVMELEEELEKEKEEKEELEKMLNLQSHKRRYNTMNYIKKNKLNKFDTVGVCQDMRAFKRTGEIKYRAYITFQNKQHTLGTYTSLDKAKEARKKGEIMVENIKKNFVEKIKGEE